MRRQGICAAALLAVTLGIMLFLPQRHYLRITYQKTGELICQRAAEPGDRLELQLTHSFEHVPWNEYYTVTEDLTFNLDALAVGGYGAGIPAEMDVPTRVEDGLVWMEEINSEFDRFQWITSQTNMKTLSLNGTVIVDFSTLPNHSFVQAEIIT